MIDLNNLEKPGSQYRMPLPKGSGVTDKPIEAQKGFGGTSISMVNSDFFNGLSI